MTEHENPGGWTPGRILGLIVGLIGMGGFGICSVCGLVLSGSTSDGWSIALMFVLPGLGITFLFFLLVRAMVRQARVPPAAPPDPPAP